METERNLWALFQLGEHMKNIMIVIALLGAATIFSDAVLPDCGRKSCGEKTDRNDEKRGRNK